MAAAVVSAGQRFKKVKVLLDETKSEWTNPLPQCTPAMFRLTAVLSVRLICRVIGMHRPAVWMGFAQGFVLGTSNSQTQCLCAVPRKIGC